MQTDWSSLEKRHCDNCNLEVVGRFCPSCGQNDKNYEGSLWRVVGDIFREQFDFHSRATRTIRALVLHPGLLAVEFRSNRRASYVAPIRMYLFSSLLFFFLIALSPNLAEDRVFSFSIGTPSYSLEAGNNETEESDPPSVVSEEQSGFQFQETQHESKYFSEDIEPVRQHLDENVNQIVSEILIRPDDSPSKNLLVFHLLRISDNLKETDKEKPSDLELWITPLVVKVLHDFGRLWEDVKNNLPLIMVILLPWMVLTSALLNCRKHVRMVHQLVFWMHVFTFAFLLLSLELFLVQFVLRGIEAAGFVTLAAYLVLLVHTYWAYHKFHGGGHFTGILTFLLLVLLYFVVLAVAFLAVVVLSIYNL